jgi:hypothetical protein
MPACPLRSAFQFLALALGWTWLWWGALVLWGKSASGPAAMLMLAIGGAGPLLAALAVLHAWIFNNTSRSTLSAILFHLSVNFTGEFLGLPAEVKPLVTAVTFALALAVVVIWGPRKLRRDSSD